MKPDSFFSKLMWNLTPVNLSFGPVFIMIGSSEKLGMSNPLFWGGVMLMLGLMSVRHKLNQVLLHLQSDSTDLS
ncbi:MAG: hypothetical protein P8M30_04840 [Planctomycetaceae bacterium]|jgi:hypothetical protein|nr:hypothetical protein [Planctomycetaceae bacterium]